MADHESVENDLLDQVKAWVTKEEPILATSVTAAGFTGIGSFHGTRQIVGIPAAAIACSIVKEVW